MDSHLPRTYFDAGWLLTAAIDSPLSLRIGPDRVIPGVVQDHARVHQPALTEDFTDM